MTSIWLILSLAIGVMLGVLFYGGLWMTIRALLVTRYPVAVTLCSLLFRTSAVLAGVVLSSRGQWQNAVACLAGLVVGRIIVSRFFVVCT
jgi:F1F0 ATPase subunit 2